jgi:O-antigen/teichoic acid export membrane protein
MRSGCSVRPLVAEGARSPAALAQLTRDLIRRVMFVGLPVLGVAFVFAPFGLCLLGPRYAETGTGLLRCILFASACRMLVIVWMSVQRVAQNTGRVLLVQTVTTACLILAAALMSRSSRDFVVFGGLLALVHFALALLTCYRVIALYRSAGAPVGAGLAVA